MAMRIFLLTILLALAACATKIEGESEYNLGVDAYKAKDYAAARQHWAKAVDEGELSAFNNLGYFSET